VGPGSKRSRRRPRHHALQLDRRVGRGRAVALDRQAIAAWGLAAARVAGDPPARAGAAAQAGRQRQRRAIGAVLDDRALGLEAGRDRVAIDQRRLEARAAAPEVGAEVAQGRAQVAGADGLAPAAAR
jgi:hypothetical protein